MLNPGAATVHMPGSFCLPTCAHAELSQVIQQHPNQAFDMSMARVVVPMAKKSEPLPTTFGRVREAAEICGEENQRNRDL